MITVMRATGASLRIIAEAITDLGHRPRRGQRRHSMVVSRILQRVDAEQVV